LCVKYNLPKLISTIDIFLLQTKNDRSKIFIISKIIPMFSSIVIFLMSFLLNWSQSKWSIFLPMLFNLSLSSPRFFDSELKDKIVQYKNFFNLLFIFLSPWYWRFWTQDRSIFTRLIVWRVCDPFVNLILVPFVIGPCATLIWDGSRALNPVAWCR